MSQRHSASRLVAAWLERGSPSPVLGALALMWSQMADPVRPLRAPTGARLVGVGGATLGGGYKTPTVAALAEALADRGLMPAVVAPGYTARGRAARRAEGHARDEGDEAALLARQLAPRQIPVIVSRDRTRSLSLASRLARHVLLDGVLQTRPRRVSCSLLVMDAEAPFGAGRCVPAGDLRASPRRLVSAADLILVVRPRWCQDPLGPLADALVRLPECRNVPVHVAESRLEGAWEAGEPGLPDAEHELAELRAMAVGVALAIARPDRVLSALADAGIQPRSTWLVRDHAGFRGPPPGGPGLDVWLTTAKCRTKLPAALGATPVWVLGHEIRLPQALLDGVIARLTC